MSNKIFILILVWTAVFALWGWAAPTSNPPGGEGLITWDKANGRLAISTTTIFSGIGTVLDLNSRKIVRLGNPTVPADAVNKRYVDNNYGGSSATRLWGEGRPDVGVVNNNGECTNTSPNPDIKISRSNIAVSWEGAAAACPTGWWVCTKDDRNKDGGDYIAFGSCGSGNKAFVECDVGGSDEYRSGHSDRAWVANRNSDRNGFHVTLAGLGGGSEGCFRLPVLCCKNL